MKNEAKNYSLLFPSQDLTVVDLTWAVASTWETWDSKLICNFEQTKLPSRSTDLFFDAKRKTSRQQQT